MYAKCGVIEQAEKVFKALPIKNIVSWNALIAGYAENGHAEEALKCSSYMQASRLSPNVITFVCMLKSCSSIGASVRGRKIHAELEQRCLGNDVVIANALINMYAKCGLLKEAHAVLDKLPFSDVISWTALIAGYVEHGQNEEALACFEQMQEKFVGISPNDVTFICILKACANIGAINVGQEVHGEVAKRGMLSENIVMNNTLVAAYAKCGMFDEAEEVFNDLVFQDLVTWNALIAGYVQYGHMSAALKCFTEMQAQGLFPDGVTFACILKACASIGAIGTGHCLHAEIHRSDLLHKDIVLSVALLDMYASCGVVSRAQEIFDEIQTAHVVLWTALIAGYVHNGQNEDALACFERMQCSGFAADSVTFICTLQACGNIGAVEKGQEMHDQIVKAGMMEEDMVIRTALLDMYTNCNMLTEALEVFDKYAIWDAVAYNVLIRNFSQHLYGEEALNHFEKMRSEGIVPDQFTLVFVLKACSSIGAPCIGQEAHSSIIQLGHDVADAVVATALVDMYANCGMLIEAQMVFDGLLVQDVVSWTVLMIGYGQLGMDLIVFYMFDRMLQEKKEPNMLVFTAMLNACSHTGSLDRGQKLFELMSKDFGLFPNSEHHNCMVDLFSRIGCLDKAFALANDIPFANDLVAWHTLLGFCHVHEARNLGKLAFEHATQLDEKDAAAYVSISNLYAIVS
ncbi:hypothetical protein KP509_09G065700 [Ceratopteris richardii]|nr:hypothetical protein KP509_09G065700 [Ceratopteris richardii]